MGHSRSLWDHTRGVQTLQGAGSALLGSQLFSQQLGCSEQGLDAQMLPLSCSQPWPKPLSAGSGRQAGVWGHLCRQHVLGPV